MKIYKYKDKLAAIHVPSSTYIVNELINRTTVVPVEHKTLCTILLEDGTYAAVPEDELEFIKEVDDDTDNNQCEDNTETSME